MYELIEVIESDVTRLIKLKNIDTDIAEELKGIKNYVFRIDADAPALRSAVQVQLDKLSELFPEFNFSATYGGK